LGIEWNIKRNSIKKSKISINMSIPWCELLSEIEELFSKIKIIRVYIYPSLLILENIIIYCLGPLLIEEGRKVVIQRAFTANKIIRWEWIIFWEVFSERLLE